MRDDIDPQEVVRMLEEGVSRKEIRGHFRCNNQVITEIARRHSLGTLDVYRDKTPPPEFSIRVSHGANVRDFFDQVILAWTDKHVGPLPYRIIIDGFDAFHNGEDPVKFMEPRL